MNNTISSGRLVSLDALRGFTMFWIIGGGSLAAALSKLSSNSFIQTFRKTVALPAIYELSNLTKKAT